MRRITGQLGKVFWFPLFAVFLFCGCTFAVRMTSYGQQGSPVLGVPGVPPIKVRLIQLKKRFDFPQRLAVSSFNVREPMKLAAELEPYLAADPDNPKEHTQAILSIDVPPNGMVQVSKFARLKDASFLLAVALPSEQGGQRGANWIDQWEYPPSWQFWRTSVRVCVDTYDVFVECELFKLRVRSSGNERLRVRVFPLQQIGGWVKWTWRSFTNGIPEELRPMLADPADFSVGTAEYVEPGDETLTRRLVRGTRYVLLVATDTNETRGALDVRMLDTQIDREVTFDLAPLR